MVGLLDALGVDRAVIAGHDWGAPLAWHSALLRPDRFRAVIGLSVPFRPRAPVAPTSVMPRRDNALFYQLYFQTPGVAEAEFERDVRQAVVKLLFAASGDAPRGATDGDVGMVPLNGGFLTGMPILSYCRPGSARRMLISMSENSCARAFVVASTGTETSTETGNCLRRSPARR